MGKKRRPPTKPSNIVNPAPPSSNTNNNPPPPRHDNPSTPSLVNASMNGISLPPAIANQILAAMTRNSGGPSMSANNNMCNNSNGANNANAPNDSNNGMSKKYLDEMGKLIASHMNQAVSSGALPPGASFGGSVRFSGPSNHPNNMASSAGSGDGMRMVYGPNPPPTVSMEFNGNWKKATNTNTNSSGNNTNSNNAPSNIIDPSSFQNIQQLFNMTSGGSASTNATTGSSTFSFTTGKMNGKTTKHNFNTNNPEDVKTMMNLFSELMGMPTNFMGDVHRGGDNNANHASTNNQPTKNGEKNTNTMPNNGSANNHQTNIPTNDELAREFYEKFIASDSSKQQQAMLNTTDPLALRKAAFAAGVNVAMQQQMMREGDVNNGSNSSGNKSANKGMAGNGKDDTGGSTNNAMNPGRNNVPMFSMIFGQGNGSNSHPQGGVGPTIPPLPPPPNGWPSGAPAAAAAAAAAAAFASSLNMKNDANGSNSNSAGNASSSQYYSPSDFAGAFASAELGSPAWLEYYFEEYARNQRGMAATASTQNSNNFRPDPPADADCCPPDHFEYGDHFEEQEERLMDEQRVILEAEETERKAKAAAKKKDKKARKKERAKKEAETKAALAAKKKREKAITSWRSRIVAACSSSDESKMETLLSESPYKNFTYNPDEFGPDNYDLDEGYIPQNQEEYLIRQLDWFLTNVLQKYPELELGKIPFEKNGAREKLAKYIMQQSIDTIFIPGPSMLRNALHSAAYHNDVDFVTWIIEGQKKAVAQNTHKKENPFSDCLDALCDDAGWAPLHYAVAAGSEGVVELLLEAGCDIWSRSDFELTCLNSSGYGVTARELATVLQSGAIYDDLSSDGDVLDEIIENRIVCANTNEKNAYMRVLRSLTERLEDVEINGYSPLSRAAEENKAGTKNNADTLENQTRTGSKKKSKKKKKKQQQQPQQRASTPSSNPNSQIEEKQEATTKPAKSPEEDLSDPVAVALLGMGFTAEQITDAAKALGGFDRATADDMVMWILSGGEVNNDEQDNSTEAEVDHDSEVSNASEAVVIETTKAEKKAAAKDQRDAEELARKRQQEIVAAERAAAKREEQRRIRREWNEREQTRQEIEKNAKIAEAAAKKKQAELQKVQMEFAAKNPNLPSIPLTIHAGGGKSKVKPNGPPQTIIAGPPHGKKPGASVSNMGIPKGPNVKAPKILARPNNTPSNTLHQTMPQAVASNQSLFPPPQGSNNALQVNAHTQPAMPNSRDSSQQRHHHPPQSSSYDPQSLSQMKSNYYNPNPGPSSFEYANAYSNDAGTMPLMDGGNKFYPGQQQSGNSIPPPGFKTDIPPSSPNNDSSLNAASNPLGEIRATAREFVPTFFAPVNETTPGGMEFNPVPSMSSQPATVSHSPPDSQAASKDVSLLLDPMSSLLNSAIPAPVTKSDSPIHSATSSITGFSGSVQEAPTSRVGSALTFEAVGGIQTSSILESITQDSAIGGFGSNGGGIWGDSNANQTSNLGGLVGLNFSSFLNGELKSDNDQSSKNQGNTGSTWGTGTGGSIW